MEGEATSEAQQPVVEVPDETSGQGAAPRKQSRSSSSSRSGSSSSSRSSRSRASSSARSRSRSSAREVPKFVIDDCVEVFGLESDGGKFLNGRKGVVVQFIEAHGRYEVSFGPERLATVRPEHLRRCEPDAPKVSAPKPEPKAQPKSDSLASLLGMGLSAQKAEAPQPEQWKPIWERSGSQQPVGVLTEEQQQVFLDLQAGEEQREAEDSRLRCQVRAECARAGVLEEALVEQAFQEQREKRDLRRLQRGRSQSPRRSRGSSASRSRSASASRGAASRSRSRSH